jgi:hypothetical protein
MKEKIQDVRVCSGLSLIYGFAFFFSKRGIFNTC